MDPPAELPLNGIHEELTVGKINWLPAEERKRDEARKEGEQVKKKRKWQRWSKSREKGQGINKSRNLE